MSYELGSLAGVGGGGVLEGGREGDDPICRCYTFLPEGAQYLLKYQNSKPSFHWLDRLPKDGHGQWRVSLKLEVHVQTLFLMGEQDFKAHWVLTQEVHRQKKAAGHLKLLACHWCSPLLHS